MEKILNKCPICGGTLYMDHLYQYSIIYKIGKKGGELKKSKRKVDNGSIECYSLYCERGDFITDYNVEVIKPKNIDIKIYQNKNGLLIYEGGNNA